MPAGRLPGTWLKLTKPQIETVAAILAQEADGLEELEDANKHCFKVRIRHLRGIVHLFEEALTKCAEAR